MSHTLLRQQHMQEDLSCLHCASLSQIKLKQNTHAHGETESKDPVHPFIMYTECVDRTRLSTDAGVNGWLAYIMNLVAVVSCASSMVRVCAFTKVARVHEDVVIARAYSCGRVDHSEPSPQSNAYIPCVRDCLFVHA